MAILVPLGLLPIPLVDGTTVGAGGYVMLLMAIFWCLEILPLEATALLPVVLFPMMKVMPTSEVTPYYMKEKCMLFLGGKPDHCCVRTRS